MNIIIFANVGTANRLHTRNALGNQILRPLHQRPALACARKAFGKLKRNAKTVVYCSQATLFNYIVGMTNSAGQLIYQANANEGANGFLLGAAVKIEESVADGKVLLGDPKKVVNNVVQDLMVETDKDIKAHKFIYSGYERSECELIDTRAFVEITVNF